MTEIEAFLFKNNWKPSNPMIYASDFWVSGAKFPVLIEIIPLLSKAIESYRSEFQAKLFTLSSWNIWDWVIKSKPIKFLFTSKTANFFLVTLISHLTILTEAL